MILYQVVDLTFLYIGLNKVARLMSKFVANLTNAKNVNIALNKVANLIYAKNVNIALNKFANLIYAKNVNIVASLT